MSSITVITSLYNSQLYLDGYFDAVKQIDNPSEVEILLIHNAPNDKELAIINTYLPSFPFIKHIVVPREGLYSSWNRGVKMATGDYIAIWNVDDIRTPDSLSLQKKALDNSDAVMCYGDFYGTDNYGQIKQKLYAHKEYPFFQWEAHRFHIIGCFPMWRKSIHAAIGYFDEQFRLVSDYEFQLRVALKYNMVKCGSFLGYYLENQKHKLSSNAFLQNKERTVVELRYRIYDKVLLHILPFLSGYSVNRFLNFGKWTRLSAVVPIKAVSIKSTLSFVAAPFTYSFWVIKRTSHAVYNFFFQ